MSKAFVKSRTNDRAVRVSGRPTSGRSAMLIAKSKAYQDAADAPSTLKAYEADYARFAAWCQKYKFRAMPASPETVGAYLAAKGSGYAIQTLRRRIAAIARACGIEGHPLDTRHPAIRETMRGIRRKHGERRRRSAALTTDEIALLCEICDDTLNGRRDRALLLLAFAGAMRRSEVVALDVEHLTWTRSGLALSIVRSKTDKDSAGDDISIPRGTGQGTCPVTALKEWLKAAEIAEGPLFRKINYGNHVQARRLSPDAVRQILLKRSRQAGLKGTRREPISPHSMRAGFITTAYRNGVSDEEIMGHTGHKSLTTMRSYVRRAKLGRSSPAGKIGL